MANFLARLFSWGRAEETERTGQPAGSPERFMAAADKARANKHYDKAAQNYCRAAELGDSVATDRLNSLYGAQLITDGDILWQIWQALREQKGDTAVKLREELRFDARTAAKIYRAEHPEEFATEPNADSLEEDPVANPEVSNLLAEGDKLHDENDFAAALTYYLQAADLGNVNAMFRIGSIYYRGLDSSQQKDVRQALAWFQKAAERGYFYAMYYIGCMYRLGDGVFQDCNAAVTWFIRAIAHNEGNPLLTSEAMMALGEMFCAGEGVAQNKKIGLSWYLTAAQAGQSMAAPMVARAYETGDGLPRNPREAARWKSKIPASAQFDSQRPNDVL